MIALCFLTTINLLLLFGIVTFLLKSADTIASINEKVEDIHDKIYGRAMVPPSRVDHGNIGDPGLIDLEVAQTYDARFTDPIDISSY